MSRKGKKKGSTSPARSQTKTPSQPKSELQDAQIEQVVVRVLEAKAEYWVGPTPPPQAMADFDRIHPGFADRIMSMTERQQEHRHHCEKLVLTSDSRTERIGQVFAFLTVVVFAAAGVWVASLGHPWPGAVLGGGGLASIVTVFIRGKKRQDGQIQEKRGDDKERMLAEDTSKK